MHDAELGGRPGDCDGALRVEDLQGADRRQNGGDAQFLAQEGDGWIDVRDVDQDAWSERDFVEGEPVAAQGRFGLRATDQIVPGALWEATAGFPNEFLIADEVESQAWRPPLCLVVGAREYYPGARSFFLRSVMSSRACAGKSLIRLGRPRAIG